MVLLQAKTTEKPLAPPVLMPARAEWGEQAASPGGTVTKPAPSPEWAVLEAGFSSLSISKERPVETLCGDLVLPPTLGVMRSLPRGLVKRVTGESQDMYHYLWPAKPCLPRCQQRTSGNRNAHLHLAG